MFLYELRCLMCLADQRHDGQRSEDDRGAQESAKCAQVQRHSTQGTGAALSVSPADRGEGKEDCTTSGQL